MKVIALFRLLEQLEDIGRPNIARTQTSRDSDRLIDSMTLALTPFVTAYLKNGQFSPIELDQLSVLFLQHAQDQYFLGKDYADKANNDKKPLSTKDLHNAQMLAAQAQADFISSLAKQYLVKQPDDIAKTAGVVAGLAAVTLGIKALNKGTISHAETVEFVTRRDSKVCPICEPLDSNIYEVDQNTGIVKDGPLIPVHPNCRCRYLVVNSSP